MKPLRQFIEEDENIKPYKFVVIYSDPKDVGDDSDEETEPLALKMLSFGKELGLTGFKAQINEAYVVKKDDKLFLYNKEDKEFLLDENTIVFNRSKSNDHPSWQNLYREITLNNIKNVNSMQTHDICFDKYRTFLTLQQENIKQPKTEVINDLSKIVDVHKRVGGKYPVILKTILGTGGVGVLKVQDEGQLLSSAQIIEKLGPDRGLILQEFIAMKYDIRVMVVAGEIMGAMKRPIAEGDFRTNVHQGSEPEKIEITELERNVVLNVAKAIDGDWVGIDLIPSTDREKIPPHLLEVNSQPGHVGYDSVHGGSILKDVLKKFKNREYWT